MHDRDDISGNAEFSVDFDVGPVVLNRREVVGGLAAGPIIAASPARSEEASARPDIRFVRNPERHNEFGVAIDFTPPAPAD